MSREPLKKVTLYPRVDVLKDEKASAPNNYYAEVAFRLKGIRIETWRMSQGKALTFASTLQRQLRDDPEVMGRELMKQVRESLNDSSKAIPPR